jgi:exosortase/archaeosortase family protein
MKQKVIADSIKVSTIYVFFNRNRQWLHEASLMVTIFLFLGLVYRIKNTGLFTWFPVGWVIHQLIVVMRDCSWFIGHYLFGLNVICKDSYILFFPESNSSILIYKGCSGCAEIFRTSLFFIFYPGCIKTKLWFIPAASLFVFMIAVFRMVGLSFAVVYRPDMWFFIHTRLMTFLFYGSIFALWVVYVEYLKPNRRTYKWG